MSSRSSAGTPSHLLSSIAWAPRVSKGTKSNFTNINYDPINFAQRASTPSLRTNRVKGMNEFKELSGVHRPISRQFSEAIRLNPKAFHRKSGEFSKFSNVSNKPRYGNVNLK